MTPDQVAVDCNPVRLQGFPVRRSDFESPLGVCWAASMRLACTSVARQQASLSERPVHALQRLTGARRVRTTSANVGVGRDRPDHCDGGKPGESLGT